MISIQIIYLVFYLPSNMQKVIILDEAILQNNLELSELKIIDENKEKYQQQIDYLEESLEQEKIKLPADTGMVSQMNKIINSLGNVLSITAVNEDILETGVIERVYKISFDQGCKESLTILENIKKVYPLTKIQNVWWRQDGYSKEGGVNVLVYTKED
ncbi:MAG: hypothetical protein BEN19_02705 [Epulopiscium sp. Nuni2H_MBin003]|nr:MAG: hypothetical protein BEN19_02705 [Epulopiscium sp. Nuni2H_MBin003]